MKDSRTCGIRTFGMLTLIKRSSPDSSAAGGSPLVLSLQSSHAFLLEALNGGLKPLPHCFFDLLLVAIPVKGIQVFTEHIEGNVAAGNLFGALLGRDQVHQNTITARSRILFRIEVRAGERVFENILRAPRRSRRATIASIFQELEFKSKNVQKIAFVLLHTAPPALQK